MSYIDYEARNRIYYLERRVLMLERELTDYKKRTIPTLLKRIEDRIVNRLERASKER